MNHRFKTLVAAVAMTAMMPLSSQAEDKPAAEKKPLEPQTIVTINGDAITDLEVLAFNALQGGQNKLDSQQAQVQLLNQLVNTTLLAQAAEKDGVDKLPQVVAALKMARIQVLAEAKVNDYFARHPVTDEEIKAAYDKKFTREALQEYKVSHILVKEEKEARDIIAALEKGEDFDKLAREHSLDSSKDAGGELGWVGRNQVVKPFGDAMSTLEKGSFSKTPVKSQFGWHVILVEDIRAQQPPPLDQVKEQFRAQLQQQQLAKLVTEMRNQATVKVAGAENAPQTAPVQDEKPAPEK
ncbi:peptidylprolyl isomerase [Thiolapillus sp.]